MYKNGRKTIGVFIPMIYHEFMTQLRIGLDSAAKNLGYNLVYFTSFSDNDSLIGKQNRIYDDGERAIFRIPCYEELDGIVMLADAFTDTQRRDLHHILRERCKCPIINLRTRQPDYYNVLSDDDTSLKNMIQHFIDKHHFTRIYFVSGPRENIHSLTRLKIYEDTMRENGLAVDPEYIFFGDFWKYCGEAAVEYFLQENTPPEAIVCANDYMAISVINALKLRGYSVPDQIAVSGYDNLEESYFLRPSLTTVRQPVKQMGRKAIQLIDQILAGEEVPQDTYLEAEPIYRQSCGCEDMTHDYTTSYTSVLSERVDNMGYIEDATTELVTFMANSGSLQECIKHLRNYTLLETGFKDFAICLANNWENQLPVPSYQYSSDNQNQMHAVVGIHNGQDIEPSTFPIQELFPEDFQLDVDNPIYFFPLHYQRYYLGYMIVSIRQNVPNNTCIKAWLMHLDSALENVRIRSKLNTVVKELENLYNRDMLTGLYNRRGFEKFGNHYFQECLDAQSPFIIMELDMDNLKQINDQYGHADGDICIRTIADSMRYAATQDEICIRSGGDEYIMVGRHYSSGQLNCYLERFKEYLEEANLKLEKPYTIGVSIGYHIEIPDNTKQPEDYLRLADHQMYEEKRCHKKSCQTEISI